MLASGLLAFSPYYSATVPTSLLGDRQSLQLHWLSFAWPLTTIITFMYLQIIFRCSPVQMSFTELLLPVTNRFSVELCSLGERMFSIFCPSFVCSLIL